MGVRYLVLVVVAVWSIALDAQSRTAADPLVGTWLLTTHEQEQSANSIKTRRPNPRGLLIHDAAGNALVIVTESGRAGYADPGAPTPSEALRAFDTFGGFWGTFTVDPARATISYVGKEAVNPNRAGGTEAVGYALSGDNLVLTQRHEGPNGARMVRTEWERLPELAELNAIQRSIAGFWEWVAEERVDARGQVVASTKRAPSVIVYTPTGHVGVHFVPGGRTRFAVGDAPTGEEARAAIRGYVGYFGTFAVHPGPLLHHYLLVHANPGTSAILYPRRLGLQGEMATLTLPPTILNGVEVRNRVTVRRLSGLSDMTSRPRP